MKKLNTEYIIKLQDRLISDSGGKKGIFDMNLLLSAIDQPFQIFNKKYLYPKIVNKAARLCFGLIRNHPFNDGNKRIGLLVMLIFLELNGICLQYTDEDLIKIGFGIADGSIDESTIINWIIEHKTT